MSNYKEGRIPSAKEFSHHSFATEPEGKNILYPPLVRNYHLPPPAMIPLFLLVALSLRTTPLLVVKIGNFEFECNYCNYKESYDLDGLGEFAHPEEDRKVDRRGEVLSIKPYIQSGGGKKS
ncbi:hypothetical protein AKJ41_04635 [candidate division MSBL1 archaeon SCGC-AAA259O05]|uniref:Uncharacterized protein n=1 Tax=candidate division MSBL1 archaeon SCGC-AAA259O05 TaxID=1698271 RepID=A0A133V0I9_9EURY|nr:hypothetical protein AKJ41_04635 [candidate division MSBL1 archaeon SCGC-AAA259O05]